MLSVRPAQVVGPLEPVFDIEIRIAASPACEFRRPRLLSGIEEGDAREAQHGSGEQGHVMLLRKARAILAGAVDTAVMAHVAKAQLFHQGRCEVSKISRAGSCALIDQRNAP